MQGTASRLPSLLSECLQTSRRMTDNDNNAADRGRAAFIPSIYRSPWLNCIQVRTFRHRKYSSNQCNTIDICPSPSEGLNATYDWWKDNPNTPNWWDDNPERSCGFFSREQIYVRNLTGPYNRLVLFTVDTSRGAADRGALPQHVALQTRFSCSWGVSTTASL